MIYNTLKLCTLALQEIGVVERGEAPEQADFDFAIDNLDEIIVTEQGIGENKFYFTTAETLIKLNVNDSSQLPVPALTLPTDFLRPKTSKLRIEALDTSFNVISAYEQPIDLVGHNSFFNASQNCYSTPIPEMIYIQTSVDAQTVQVWPTITPVQASQNVWLVLTYEKIMAYPLEDSIANYSATLNYVSIPDMLSEMYKMKLALKLCNGFGIPNPRKEEIRADVMRLNTLKTQASNQRNVRTAFRPALSPVQEISNDFNKNARFNSWWNP